jgi:acetolactate synthase-1/2/3 large subunit
MNLARVVTHLNEALPGEAIIANDAGNFAIWLHRFYRHRQFGTQIAPTSGAMGYGLPAAIAAKLEYPTRDVIALIGDGGFMMNGNELATAMRHNINVVTLVIDNSSFGTIRMHQERHYPGRTHATDLANPDFVAYAESFGVFAQRVERTEDFPAALAAARAANKPALIHSLTDIENIAPGVTVRALRQKS